MIINATEKVRRNWMSSHGWMVIVYSLICSLCNCFGYKWMPWYGYNLVKFYLTRMDFWSPAIKM